jgi:hypothetical protein
LEEDPAEHFYSLGQSALGDVRDEHRQSGTLTELKSVIEL